MRKCRLYAELETARSRSGSRPRNGVAERGEARVEIYSVGVMCMIVRGATWLARIGQQRREQLTRR